MGNALKMVLTVSNQNLLKKEARLKRTGQKTQMKSWPPTWLNVRRWTSSTVSNRNYVSCS
jgi:hypothetical protein